MRFGMFFLRFGKYGLKIKPYIKIEMKVIFVKTDRYSSVEINTHSLIRLISQFRDI